MMDNWDRAVLIGWMIAMGLLCVIVAVVEP